MVSSSISSSSKRRRHSRRRRVHPPHWDMAEFVRLTPLLLGGLIGRGVGRGTALGNVVPVLQGTSGAVSGMRVRRQEGARCLLLCSKRGTAREREWLTFLSVTLQQPPTTTTGMARRSPGGLPRTAAAAYGPAAATAGQRRTHVAQCCEGQEQHHTASRISGGTNRDRYSWGWVAPEGGQGLGGSPGRARGGRHALPPGNRRKGKER